MSIGGSGAIDWLPERQRLNHCGWRKFHVPKEDISQQFIRHNTSTKCIDHQAYWLRQANHS